MQPYEEDRSPESARLERESMVWPPASWEHDGPAWRDDLPDTPDAFTPFDAASAALDTVLRAPTAVAPRPAYAAVVREVIETIALTAVIFLGIRLVVQNFRIEGRSMEPTLHSGEYLLVNKLAFHALGDPNRGDIVVFQAWGQDKDFIKRIVGTPGDNIEIRDGCVHVNGTCIDEPYLDQPTTDAVGPLTLGQDEYYVLGDNRGNSSDSRAYGPLPRDKIIGKAWFTYWPPSDIGLVPAGDASLASAR
jgi:signal peptidase I